MSQCSRVSHFSSLVFLSLIAALHASPAELGADEADALVRAQWFEGIPESRLSRLSPEAVRHLGALLRDPAEREHHATTLEVLGRAGGEGAFEQVEAYARVAPVGDMPAAVYRARLALPIAYGYLARKDDRALAKLIAAVGPEAAPAAWQYRHLDASRVGVLLQKMAVTGLALSGRAEARAALLSLSYQGGSSKASLRSAGFSDLRAHIAEALNAQALHAAPQEVE